MSPVKLEDTVLGQYTAAGDQRGYLEDETVPKGSKTPTFATCVMNINNERRVRGPFISSAGVMLSSGRACFVKFRWKSEVSVSLSSFSSDLLSQAILTEVAAS